MREIVGGLFLLGIDLYAVIAGRFPLRGGKSVSVENHPNIFWAGVTIFFFLALAALRTGLVRLRDRRSSEH